MLQFDPDELCSQESSPVVTLSLIAEALGRIEIPPAQLMVQPPNGRTLVNFATNFYTPAETITRSVTLLGQTVDFRIRPSQFHWHFDDGDTTTTTTAGSPYPDLEITHTYLRTATHTPRVDTTYAADFRIAGGAWRPVPGTVTIDGTGVDLEVVEAQPTLVGYE